MKATWKRCLSLLLCVVMVLGLLPPVTMPASAAEADDVLYENSFDMAAAPSPLADFANVTGGFATYIGAQVSELVQDDADHGQVWKLKNGSGSGLDSLAFAKRLDGNYADFSFSFDLKTAAANEMLVRFRSSSDGDSGYMVSMKGDALTFTKRGANDIAICDGNVVTLPAGTRTDDWQTYQIAIVGKTITMWIDGEQVAELEDTNTDVEWASGGITFAGWGTEILVDNLKVEELNVYANDFGGEDALADFANVTGGFATYIGAQVSELVQDDADHGQVWKLKNGSGSGLDSLAFAKRLDGNYADFSFSFDLKTTAANEMLVRFRSSSDGDSGYMVSMKGDALTFTKRGANDIAICDGNVVTLPAGTRTDGWQTYQIAIAGKTITMWIDGEQVAELEDTNTDVEWASGGITFAGWGTEILVDNLKVETAESVYENTFENEAPAESPLDDFAPFTEGGILGYINGQVSELVDEEGRGQVWNLGAQNASGTTQAFTMGLFEDFADYTLTFDMKESLLAGDGNAYLYLRTTASSDSGYSITMTGNNIVLAKRIQKQDGQYSWSDLALATADLTEVDRTGGWHSYKVTVVGKTITLWIDDTQVLSVTDEDTTNEWASGGIVFAGWRNRLYVDDLKIVKAEASEGGDQEDQDDPADYLFYDDFSSDLSKWTLKSGVASVEDGDLNLKPKEDNWDSKLVTVAGSDWTDYEAEVEFTVDRWIGLTNVSWWAANDCLSVSVRADLTGDSQTENWADSILRRQDSKLELKEQNGGEAATPKTHGVSVGTKYQMKVKVVGQTVEMWLAEADMEYAAEPNIANTFADIPAVGGLMICSNNAETTIHKVKVKDLTVPSEDEDETVTEDVLFADDFEDAAVSAGNYSAFADGGIVMYTNGQVSEVVSEEGRGQVWNLGAKDTATYSQAFAMGVAKEFANYTLTFDMKESMLANNGNAIVYLRSTTSSDSGYAFTMTGNNIVLAKRIQKQDGQYSWSDLPLATVDLTEVDRTGGWHTYKVTVVDKTITLWIDDVQILSVTDEDTTNEWASGGIYFAGWRNRVYIDNIKVVAADNALFADDFEDADFSRENWANVTEGGIVMYTNNQRMDFAEEADRGQVLTIGAESTATYSQAFSKRLAGPFTDYTLTFDMKENLLKSDGNLVLTLRATESSDSGYSFTISGNTVGLAKRVNIPSGNYQWSDLTVKTAEIPAELNRGSGWHSYKATVVGKNIALWIDDVEILSAVDTDVTNGWATGGIIFSGWRNQVTLDNVRVVPAQAAGMPDVESVPFTMNKQTVRLSVGDDTSVSPLYEKISDKGSAFTYASSDETVAVADEYGIITAKGTGEAVITCTAADGAEATVTVYVNAACSTFYYVAPNGSDTTGDGSEANPFATIEKARDTIRGLALPEGGVTVYLRGGEHYLNETIQFTPEDSGEAGKPIVYASYPGENAVIHSGQRLTGWTKLEEDAYPAGLPEKAYGNVFVTDITPGWRFHDLYVNGERQQVARMYNNDDWETWGTFPSMPQSPLDTKDPKGMKATFQDGHLDNLPSNGDVELYLLPVVWWNSLPVVTNIDAENNTAYLESFNPSIEPNGVGGTLFQHNGKYNLMNAPKFLDEAGEWCVDSENGKVYWWPKNMGDLSKAVAPHLYELIRLQGDEEAQNWAEQVEYIEFRDLTFQYTDRLPENQWSDSKTNPDLVVRNAENPDAAIFMQGVANCAVIDSKILNTGAYAIALDHYAKDNRIVRNEMGNLGCGGVQLVGYGPGSGKTWNINTRNVVLANNVHDLGLAPYQHSSAITIYGASYTDGKFNTIENMPYSAIMITGADADSMNPTYTKAGRTGFNGRAYVDTYGNLTQYGIRTDEILALGESVYTTFNTSRDNGRAAIPYQSSDFNIMEYNIAREYMMVMNDGGCYYAWSNGKNNEYNFNVAQKSGMGKGTLFPLYMDDYASYVKLEGNQVFAPQLSQIDKSQGTNIWKNNGWSSSETAAFTELVQKIEARVEAMGGYLSTENGNVYELAPAIDGITVAPDDAADWRFTVTMPALPEGAVKFVYEHNDSCDCKVYLGGFAGADKELTAAAGNSILALQDTKLAIYAVDTYGAVVAHSCVAIENDRVGENVYMYEDFEKETDGQFGPRYAWEKISGDDPVYVAVTEQNHVLDSDPVQSGGLKMYTQTGNESWTDYSVEMDFLLDEWQPEGLILDGLYDSIGLLGHLQDDQNNWQLIVRKNSGKLELNMFRENSGNKITEVDFVPEFDVWYKMKLEFSGKTINAYVAKQDQDYGAPVITYVNNAGYIPAGGVGINTLGADFQMDNVKVVGPANASGLLETQLEQVKALDTTLNSQEVREELEQAVAAAEALLEQPKPAEEDILSALEALAKAAEKAEAEAAENGENKKAAEAVDALIDAIGEVTLNSGDAIDAARAAYDALTDAQKAYVEGLSDLETAEATYAALVAADEKEKADKAAAAEVDALIDAIGEVTLNSGDAIDAARAAYDALTEDQKAFVEGLSDLEAAEATYAALVAADEKAKADQAAAEAVIEQIEDIGLVLRGSKDEIEAARAAYESLTEDQKALVPEEVVKALEHAEEKLAAVLLPTKPVKPSKPAAPTVAPKFAFTDVAEDAWYYDEVKEAWEKGLIDGMTADKFDPNGSLTVAQAIKLAAALHQLENDGKVTLKNGSDIWYTTYVDYAIANGIIDAAYADYSYAQMNTAATRKEFVGIFHGAKDGYMEKNVVADNAIPDVKQGDAYAEEIYEFYRAGILTGNDESGSFAPNSNIKRSEVATILVRMYDIDARAAITLK